MAPAAGGDNVIISTGDFEKMVKRIQKQDDYIEELEKANEFLNAQIEEYTKEFTKPKETK